MPYRFSFPSQCLSGKLPEHTTNKIIPSPEGVFFMPSSPPTWEVLWRHWLRCCRDTDFWALACNNAYNLLPLSKYGWKVNGECLEIDWDSNENLETVRDTVSLLLKGCSCKTGCSSKRCSCCKAGRKCGPGCRCSNCNNVTNI